MFRFWICNESGAPYFTIVSFTVLELNLLRKLLQVVLLLLWQDQQHCAQLANSMNFQDLHLLTHFRLSLGVWSLIYGVILWCFESGLS